MKYNEFEQLNAILENKGTNLNAFVKTNTGKNLFEAEEELDTKSGNVLTRSGRARIKMNDNAKKVQTQLMDNLFDKYYGPALQDKAKIMDQIVKMADSNKTPEEIKDTLMTNINAANKAQFAQLGVLDKAADKILMNYTKKIDALVQKSKMTENNKLNLSNYWVMLTSQIKLNLYKFIQKKELAFIDSKLVGKADGNEDLANLMKNKSLYDLAKKNADAAAAKKAEVAKQVKEEEAAEKAAEETKAPETGAEETKAPETGAEETKAPETGAEETKAPETADAEETEIPKGEEEQITPDETTTKETPAEKKPEWNQGVKDEKEKQDAAKAKMAGEEGKLPANLTMGKVYQLQSGGKDHDAKILGVSKGNVIFSIDGEGKKKMPLKDAATKFGDEIIDTEAEEVEYTDKKNKPIEKGQMYSFTDKKGQPQTATITRMENGKVYYKVTGDDKEHVMANALAGQKLVPKAIGTGAPVKDKKAIKMGSGTPSSSGKTIVAPEKTESTQKAETKAAKVPAKRKARTSAPATGNLKTKTNVKK